MARPEKGRATHEVDEILRLYPNFGDKAVFDFERRNIDPAIIAKMVDGLTKAGLDVAPDWEAADGKGEHAKAAQGTGGADGAVLTAAQLVALEKVRQDSDERAAFSRRVRQRVLQLQAASAPRSSRYRQRSGIREGRSSRFCRLTGCSPGRRDRVGSSSDNCE